MAVHLSLAPFPTFDLHFNIRTSPLTTGVKSETICAMSISVTRSTWVVLISRRIVTTILRAIQAARMTLMITTVRMRKRQLARSKNKMKNWAAKKVAIFQDIILERVLHAFTEVKKLYVVIRRRRTWLLSSPTQNATAFDTRRSVGERHHLVESG